MKRFLYYVARDILKKYGDNLSHIAVVFPNKRASLFLNEELATQAGHPIWSPAYITISDLFRRHSTLAVGDPIKLVCDLHKSYNEVTGLNEDLDKFYGWGQLLISDFDDIDKNMADATKIFSNLKDIHEYDDVNYLSEEQKDILRRFFKNFNIDKESELKQRFFRLWSHFLDIYNDFNARLERQGLAYEGALYRRVVNDQSVTFKYDTYLFVGFNMMQQVELRLCDRLQKAGKAKFYWDFDDYYMHGQEAGHYIAQYLKAYPNELDTTDAEIYRNFSRPKDIRFIEASTENIQARYVADWLLDNQGERINAGSRTAVVLCDENLLPTVIHSLPDEVEKLNVTTGFPLAQTPVATLVNILVELQTKGYSPSADKYRLHWIRMILRHPYARYIADTDRDPLNEVGKRFYFSGDELAGDDEGLRLLFHYPANGLSHWLLDILRRIGAHYHQAVADDQAPSVKDPFFQEALFRMYTLINRLCALIDAGDLTEDLNIWQRLLGQLIKTTSIPFHGEPVVGTQVMGVLETRNLDFDHVLLLSTNEGNMPKSVNDSSFIPYAIRKAFGLTTIDNKVAIYAYYFHRLLQRASDVTLCFNHATTDNRNGEMSRFMLQLLVESRQPIRRESLTVGQVPVKTVITPIEKDEAVMRVLNGTRSLSPTALNNFIYCQLKFYYRFVAKITEPDDTDEDEVDNRIFGNIFHKAAELLYRGLMDRNGLVTKEKLEETLKHPEQFDILVDRAFNEELFHFDEHQKAEYNGLQYINRQVIIDYLRQLARIDKDQAPFTILGLEKNVGHEFNVEMADGQSRNVAIYGFIDRLDKVRRKDQNGMQKEYIRVVDYKTGANNKLAVKTVDEIFTGDNLQNHTDYFLQTMLYALIVEMLKKGRDGAAGLPERLAHEAPTPVIPALLYIQHAGGADYDPVLAIGKEKIDDIRAYAPDFEAGLKRLLADIYNPDEPFKPTSDKDRCTRCPYRALCGRPE
ncbi:MAG: PD-(D/E)XK nuclease family protein [Prevotella sp.]|nr:PD-(D/E)XK nuclease family protein [Prevotella sp.]